MPDKRNWDQAAGAVWPVIVKSASERKLLTYGDLSPVAKTNPLSVGRALGPIQSYCLDNRLPPLTAIVVGKFSGMPGEGFVAWDIDDVEEAFQAVFGYNWGILDNPFSVFSEGETEETIASRLVNTPELAGQVYALVKVRGIAQRIFRRALLDSYGSCCMCGLSFESALEAAHIIPWGDCEPDERMDIRNGLLLCSNHHRLFDAKLITITTNYYIEYCDPDEDDGPYSKSDQTLSTLINGLKIILPTNKSLHPDKEKIRKRRALHEWD